MAVFTAVEALNMALRIEQNGQTFYTAAAERARQPEVKAVLDDLAVQEQRHYRAFQRMLDRLAVEPSSLTVPGLDEYDLYVQTALDNALFAGPDKALAALDEAGEEKQALRIALGFEKDTLLFFYDLRDMMREAERSTVDEIIREEKAHVRRLALLLR